MTSVSEGFSQVKEASRRHRGWPLLLLAAPAGIATWSGWVGLGQLTGFGRVAPLPGIADGFELDTSILLPIGVEAYGAYALSKWLTSTGLSRSTRDFAKFSALGALGLGMAGQVAYHLLTVAGVQPGGAPWWLVAAVACLPVLVLGMGAALHHMISRDMARMEETRGDNDGSDDARRLGGQEAGGTPDRGGSDHADREGPGAGLGHGDPVTGSAVLGHGRDRDVPAESPGEVTQPLPVVPSTLVAKRKRDVLLDRLTELGHDLDAVARSGPGSELEAAAKSAVPGIVEWAADAGVDMDRSYGYDVLRRELRRRRSQQPVTATSSDSEGESAQVVELPTAAGGEF